MPMRASPDGMPSWISIRMRDQVSKERQRDQINVSQTKSKPSLLQVGVIWQMLCYNPLTGCVFQFYILSEAMVDCYNSHNSQALALATNPMKT